MKVSNEKQRVKARLLMTYVKRNIRLILMLSIGALILVAIASSSGGLCYFASKKSMYLASKESPIDVVYQQDSYMWMDWLPHPQEFLRLISNKTGVVDVYGMAAIIVDLNVTVNDQSRGTYEILIIAVSKKGGLNVTLSQGSPIQGSNEMLVSEDFYETFNVTLGGEVRLTEVISTEPLEIEQVLGHPTGVTPKRFSQLIKELGMHSYLLLAGHTEAKLLSFDEYPFVLLNMSSKMVPLYFLDYAVGHGYFPKILATFFVKFDHEVYVNPWDADVTVFNLKELGQNLRDELNNYTSELVEYEYHAISIRTIPSAVMFKELSRFISINKLTIIAFGATIASVGWYFYSSVTQTALSARVKGLQLMRVRGVSQASIARTISLILTAAGTIGTVFGVLVGFVTTTNISATVLDVPISELDIVQTFGASSLLVYAFFGLAASIISQRQALARIETATLTAEPPEEAVKPELGMTGKLALTVILFLGSIKVACWLLGLNLVGEGQTINPITSALLLFVRLVDQTVLDALGALLFIYALVTIVSRRTGILSTISHWISRALSPHLSLVSKKVMNVKSVKMAGIMIVASLLIFNAVSANMGYYGVETAWRNLSATIVGADIRIDIPEEASPNLIQVLDDDPHVDDYTQILTVASMLEPPLGTCVVYAIDPGKYAAVLKTATGGLESMTTIDIFASEFFYEMGLLSVGDTVALDVEKELTVRGFIKSFAGVLSIPPVERFAILSVESLESLDCTILFRTFLLRVSANQPDTVLEEVIEELPENVRVKLSAATESQMSAEFWGRMAAPLIVEGVMSMLLIASVVGVVFAALAFGVMGYGEAISRKSLNSLLRVKGVTRRQLLGLAFSEALCILALSLVIGLLTGYAMAKGYTSYFSSAFPIEAVPTLSHGLIAQLLTLTAIYILAFLTPTLYAWKRPVRLAIQ